MVSIEQVKKNVSKRGWQDDLLVTNIGEEVKHNTTLIGHFLKHLLLQKPAFTSVHLRNLISTVSVRVCPGTVSGNIAIVVFVMSQ